MEDASLDEFLGGDAEEESAAAETATTEGDEISGEASDSADETERSSSPDADSGSIDADVDRARPTMVFDPEGDPCETCDAMVQRRWRAGDGLYCAECLEW